MAWMDISAELLVELLELPEGTSLGSDPSRNIRLEVFHSSIPEGVEGVLPTWMKKGDVREFLKFESINLPAFPRD